MTCAKGMAGSNNAPLEEVLIAAAYQDNERYRISGARGVYGEEGRDSDGTKCDNGLAGPGQKVAALPCCQVLCGIVAPFTLIDVKVTAGALCASAVRPMRKTMSSCGAHLNIVHSHTALMCFRWRWSRWRLVPPAQRLGTARRVRPVVARPPWLPPAGSVIWQVCPPSCIEAGCISHNLSPSSLTAPCLRRWINTCCKQ